MMLLDNNKLPELLSHARTISIQAGHAIMRVYNSDDFDVTKKDDKSPLTAADLAAHHLIIESLAQLPFDFPILSEESDSIPFSVRETWETYWLIDPLDGTREFIKRNGEFTVNIALIHQHKPVLGVVHAPVINETFCAAEGLGAHFTGPDGETKNIQCKALNNRKPVVVGSRSHANEELTQFLENIGNHTLISMGSSLKICLIADGRADLYPRIGLTSEWDTAAAQCVVEQAGGQLTKTDLTPLEYNTKESLLNPYFFVFGKNSKDWSEFYSGNH